MDYLRLYVFLLLVALSAPAGATTIVYETSNLSDVTPGEDLWSYRYVVSDRTFDSGFGFSISFDHTLYRDLDLLGPPVGSDWDVLILQPDPLLPDPGLYDALALVDGATNETSFAVSFVWLGADAPQAQPFTVYEPGFREIEIGVTTPVPEATRLLIAVGKRSSNPVFPACVKSASLLAPGGGKDGEGEAHGAGSILAGAPRGDRA